MLRINVTQLICNWELGFELHVSSDPGASNRITTHLNLHLLGLSPAIPLKEPLN